MEDSISELNIEVLPLKKAATIIRALNHKLRQSIITLIHEHKRITVTELYVKLRIEQSVASQHLAVLRQAGFVKTQRDGKNIFYSANYDNVNQLYHLIGQLLEKP